MPTFDFPTLFWWGLPVVAAPLAIHLINLLRQRRVKFAALEFLLASQRRYRTRVLLRQVLLLLLRTALLLGLVLALAQPRWRQAIGGLLGAGRVAHLVLLDDTLSMADTTGAVPGAEGRA
ncbi:MAG: BatA domain-containing protein [Planctomycetia bacterium]